MQYFFFILFSSVLALFSFNNIQAQVIQVEEETAIRRLLDIKKSNNTKPDRVIRAWSIQILTSRDKYQVLQKMQEARAYFKDQSNVKIDWTYEQPYYRLNAGAFYTKLEAAGLLYQIAKYYPEAYLFKNMNVKPEDF